MESGKQQNGKPVYGEFLTKGKDNGHGNCPTCGTGYVLLPSGLHCPWCSLCRNVSKMGQSVANSMRGACDEQTCDEWFPIKKECSHKCKGDSLVEAFLCQHDQPCDCAVCEDITLREEAKAKLQSLIDDMRTLAFQRGRDSLKNELIDWLNKGFDYENSIMTVHTVREVIQRYCRVI